MSEFVKFFHILDHTWDVIFLIAILIGEGMVLICIYIMTNNIEHFPVLICNLYVLFGKVSV